MVAGGWEALRLDYTSCRGNKRKRRTQIIIVIGMGHVT